MAGGGDLQLGAHHQRVAELPGRAHGRLRDGATVGTDEVHQPEAEALHPGQGGQCVHIAQGAVGFDQGMHRQPGALAVHAGGVLDLGDGLLQVGQMAWLGHHQIGQPVTRTADQGVDVAGKGRVVDRMHPRTHPVEAVVVGQGQVGAQLGVFGFGANRRAVFAIERDVEHRAHLSLQRQRLAHALLGAAVVVAHGQVDRWVAFVDQRLAGQQDGHGWSPMETGLATSCRTAPVAWPAAGRLAAYSRCFTPSCSPCSSARVLLMHSWLKASIARPSTILYSPPAQVTG